MSKQHPDKDDIALFRNSVKGVKRLRNDRIPPRPRKIAPIPRKTLEDESEVLKEALSSDFDPSEVETGEELLFSRPGLQHGLMRKLRRGLFSVAAEFDMHGLTAAQARHALTTFLASCQNSDLRCVRIIHGKGHSSPGKKPVLKSRLNSWLQHYDAVLAFCSARPNDGGTGAVYVLLKRGP